MEKSKYKRGYWPKERCLEEAKKYRTRMDFKKNASAPAFSMSSDHVRPVFVPSSAMRI